MNTPTYHKALQVLDGIDPSKYAAERNYLEKSTRLSVYITRGILTLPQIKEHLLLKFTTNQCYKLIFELAWREYWQREWRVRGDAIFWDIKRSQENVESELLPAAILNASTRVEVLDAGIRQLYETGYVHNHMRMWLSGLICNIAHTHWRHPADWMYYHLLDGDPASNDLSWQWVAGTFSSKTYLPAQENINKYSKTKQFNTYLDQSYEMLAEMPTPDILSERQATNLTWTAPETQELIIDKSKPTLLYHSFWLNSQWYKDVDASRILVLEPHWFKAHPVSQKVMDSILKIALEIPGMQVYVGDISSLKATLNPNIKYINHPSLNGWPGVAEDMPMLFPDVPLKSFGSFMSYWKQCEKTL